MDLFTPHVVTVIGMTLTHFLWQGTAIGLVTAAVLATCPRAMARTRYLIAGAGLIAMTTAPMVTLGLGWQAPATEALPVFTTAVETTATGAATPATLLPWLPMVVTLWGLGVLLLTMRLVVAWFRTERVRRRDVHAVSVGLQGAAGRLAQHLGITRSIALFASPRIDVPTVIGWLRPTILLPVGALTGLSVQQVEAVLAHELAHIKRHDYLVNALQHFAETVFFYHPAVWWLSRQIRIEREHCCDDVAVEACGNAVMYARALAALEESRQRQATLALAATDGSLVDRVRRLVGPGHTDTRRPALPIAVCVAVILGVLTFGGAQARTQDLPAVAEAVEVAPSFERIDSSTIQLDGVPYTRGTADDLRRLVRNEAPQGAAQTPVVRVGGDVKEPIKIRDVQPVYPQAARDAGISGVVILEAVIDRDGLPVNIRVLRSIPDLDQAAINAVRGWRYVPTKLNDVPVAVMMTVTVNFTLQSAAERQEALERRIVDLIRLGEQNAQSDTPAQADALRELSRELEELQRRLRQTGPPRVVEATEVRAGGTANLALGTPSRVLEGRTPTADDGILRVGGAISEPRKIQNVSPVYPEAARAAGVSGVVILEVTISAEGDVADARILRSIPLLDQAALDAILQWKYEPAMVGGVPTAIKMTATVMFRADE